MRAPCRARYGLTLAVCLALWGGCAANAQAQTDRFRRVFDRQQLIDYGVMRPADVFGLLPDWTAYSIDGFTFRAAPNGLSHYTGQRWMLFIDGRPVETSALETLSLNAQPLTVQEVDSVVVTGRPGMVNGYFAERGSIQIFTRKVEQGFDMGGSVNTGNEINDPGPFIYTPYATPNIDRIGPDLSAFAKGGKGGFYAGASTLYREHHATDQHIGYRTRMLHNNANHSPRLLLWSNSVALGHKNARGSTELSLSRSRLDDFPFIQTYGGEIPMRQTVTAAFLRAGYALGPGFSFLWSANATEEHLGKRDNFLEWDPALKIDFLRSRLQLRYSGDRIQLYGGGGVDRFGARPFYYVLTTHHYMTLRGQAGAALATPDGSISIDAEVAVIGGHTLPKLAVGYEHGTAAGGTIGIKAGYSSRSAQEDNSLWYWLHQGYGGFRQLGPDPDGFPTLGAARQATFDAVGRLPLGGGVEATGALGLRHQSSQWVAFKNFVFVPEENRFSGDVRLVPEVGGVTVSAGGGIGHQLGDRFDQAADYRYQGELSGGAFFREMAREVPRHTALYRLRYRPAESFSLSTRLRLQSPTEWSAFYTVRGDHTPFYDGPVVPSQLNIGIFARKSALDGRLYVALGIDNLLNRPLRQWPGGEVNHMTFEIQLGVGLERRQLTTRKRVETEMERPFY